MVGKIASLNGMAVILLISNRTKKPTIAIFSPNVITDQIQYVSSNGKHDHFDERFIVHLFLKRRGKLRKCWCFHCGHHCHSVNLKTLLLSRLFFYLKNYMYLSWTCRKYSWWLVILLLYLSFDFDLPRDPYWGQIVFKEQVSIGFKFTLL